MFSEGLGAPAGSALAGSAGDVERARRIKHLFGGGMRQTGILAAAALHSLDHHRDRLAEDHAHARAFAERLAEIDAVQIDLARVQTNIVRFRLASPVAEAVSEWCAAKGLKILPVSPYAMRAVFHLNVRRDHMLGAVEIIRDAVSGIA
ncbi:hypothetical protein SmB9_09560 [Sphingosinicella microcystinivorans]|uniref:Aromatic amino acid beta-eliminating lyase/threonine aldolase domain-containing protein n=1 Tax=Sphingosinicella microcystinivorans TaxID=335406 RepID=A0AAD1G010_SPHMI|nr:beta-eliminating lyase-related protein [Sphingosinicella microcystinivorans]BBE33298.1 hypothetical protein SmB9_09560 [Sphingosinicella microcystinivorans]